MTDRPRRSSIDPVTREAAAWFARLRADDVSEQDRAGFDAWMAADPKHREAYAGFERFWSTTGGYAAHPTVALAAHEVTAQVPAVAPSPRPAAAATVRRVPASRRRVLALAASVAAVALGASYLLAGFSSRTYETAVGEQRTVALADGSRLTLNTDTRLRVRYTNERRGVELERGQAYFRVAKDAQRPFEVETRNGLVRAIGTAFDVYENGGEIIVTVVEGAVLVTDPAMKDDSLPGTLPATDTGMHKILRANERLALASVKQIPVVAVQPAPAGNSVAWLTGKLIFDNEPLGKAVSEINRYSGKRILLGDKELESLHLSGVFRAGEPDEFVASVSHYFALHVEADAHGNYVLHARQEPAG